MQWLDAFKRRVVRLLTSPGEELGRGARFLRYQLRLWGVCARRLKANNAMAMSSALSFRTIFAMVPVIVLTLVIAKGFAIDRGRQSLRTFLESSGFTRIVLPTSGASTAPAGAAPATAPGQAETRPARVINVADEIEHAVRNVEAKLTFGAIGPVGVALLIWTALTLLTTMERSLNRIFGAPRSRGLARRTMLYWSAMTLGPLAAGLAAYASDQAVAFMQRAGGLSWILAGVGRVQPILVGVLLLTACYVLMPNTRVGFRAALGGAVVAYAIWLLAKWGFGIYVEKLVARGNLYGSIGLLPLFLLWLNLSWYLFLFGAEIAHTAQTIDDIDFAPAPETPSTGPWETLAAALAVAERFAAGTAPVEIPEVAARLRVSNETAAELLERLLAQGVLCRVEEDGGRAFVPRCDPRQIPVAEILGLTGRTSADDDTRRFAPELARAVQKVRRAAGLGVAETSLADLLAEMSPSAAPSREP